MKTIARKPAKEDSVASDNTPELKAQYHKCVEYIVRVNEYLVRGMDDRSVDELLDKIAAIRKILTEEKNVVVGRLLKSLSATTTIEIDEACTEE